MEKKRLIAIGAGALVLVIAGVVTWRTISARQAARLAASAVAAGARDDAMGYVEAESLARQAAKKKSTPEHEALHAWLLGLWGLRAGDEEAWGRAAAVATRLDRLAQKPPLAYAAKSLVALHEKRPGDAILEAGRGLMEAPRMAELLWVRARAERALEKPGEALKSLDDALAASPEFVPAYFEKGMLQKARGKRKDAIAALTEVVHRSARHQAVVYLGELMLETGGSFVNLLALTPCDKVELALVDYSQATGGKQPSAAFSAAYTASCAPAGGP